VATLPDRFCVHLIACVPWCNEKSPLWQGGDVMVRYVTIVEGEGANVGAGPDDSLLPFLLIPLLFLLHPCTGVIQRRRAQVNDF